MLNKKGAMFGLDARIALAIFGALSVISGAALYSAIQEAKNQQIISMFSEISKGFEAYYIDTGIIPAQAESNTSSLDIVQLIENSNNVDGWAGPYLTEEILHTDSATKIGSLQVYTGCSQDLSGDGIKPGYANAKLRKFTNPTVSTKDDYRLHIQCISLQASESLAQKFNGKDVASSTNLDNIFFNDFGSGTDKQVYFKIFTGNK